MVKRNFKDLVRQTVRYLRKNQTKAEKIFWEVVRHRRFYRNKFLRQHPIIFEWDDRKRFFVADFYCYKAKLVVEIDGGIHEKQKDYDRLREDVLKCYLDLRVIRFSNEMVINNLEKALRQLKKEMALPLSS